MRSRAVDADGKPTGAKDERGILLDLSLHDVQAMSQREPGSVARYLEERREQEAEFKEKQREEDKKERFIEQFMAAGGTSKAEGEKAYQALRNERAVEAARAADERAAYEMRRRVTSKL